jgi:hypothetical protein
MFRPQHFESPYPRESKARHLTARVSSAWFVEVAPAMYVRFDRFADGQINAINSAALCQDLPCDQTNNPAYDGT